MTKNKKKITVEEFDNLFEEDMDKALDYFDTDKAVRKINVDFNINTIKYLDVISNEIGITRQSLIKLWIHERIQDEIDRKINRGGKVG